MYKFVFFSRSINKTKIKKLFSSADINFRIFGHMIKNVVPFKSDDTVPSFHIMQN